MTSSPAISELRGLVAGGSGLALLPNDRVLDELAGGPRMRAWSGTHQASLASRRSTRILTTCRETSAGSSVTRSNAYAPRASRRRLKGAD
jgi:hypothetical protein